VAARELFLFAAFGELLQSVSAGCVQQTIARTGVIDVRHDERLRDQAGNSVNHVRRGGLGARHDRADRLQVEGAGEDRQAAEQHPLGLRQQLVAPIERRPQGLVPRQSRPPSSGQQPKAIIEAGGEPLDAERGDACRRHFNRQRNAIEAPADRRDCRCPT
jgi:hypothetical protein